MPELDVPVSAVPKTDPQSKANAGRSERRREKRFKGSRQVWIQATDAGGAITEEIQIMRNYSRGGFYFITSQHCYSVGMRLHVIPSLGSLNLEFVAEVVRVEPRPMMAYGVGVRLLHIHEPTAPEKLG
jgi:hypothetical protein